jgi:hypothetical protein
MTSETILPGFKRCAKCKEPKPISEFSRNRTKKDGLHGWCKPCWKQPKLNPEPEPAGRKRRPILVPLEPVEIEEPQRWVPVERASMPSVSIAEPVSEPKRVEPKIDIDAEKATREELTEFVKSFVVEYLARNGETCDEFFAQWISYRYPEVSQQAVRRAINDLLEEAKVKVTRWEAHCFERVNFLELT